MQWFHRALKWNRECLSHGERLTRRSERKHEGAKKCFGKGF